MDEMQDFQRMRDEEHLKLLSIFYYIAGGLTALVSLIPLIHVVLGSVLLIGSTADDGPPAALGGLMVLIGGTIIVVGMTIAAIKIYAGYCLYRRRHRTFCFVAAGLSLLAIPYGTLLGIMTFIVLLRDSVRDLFEGPTGAAEV